VLLQVDGLIPGHFSFVSIHSYDRCSSAFIYSCKCETHFATVDGGWESAPYTVDHATWPLLSQYSQSNAASYNANSKRLSSVHGRIKRSLPLV